MCRASVSPRNFRPLFLLCVGAFLWLGAIPARALTVGQRIQASQAANVRDAPAGTKISTRALGDTGTITDGPVSGSLTQGGTVYVWWQVDWDTGVDGWCFQDGLAPAPVEGAELLYGIDVSRWQGAITWSEVAGADITYAFCKGTEGVDYTDPQFTANMNNGRAAGVLMGIYHFARPENNTALDEARHFVRTATPYLLAGGMRPVLDLESGSTLGKAALSAWTRTWCQEVERLTTLRPIIYTSRNYAANFAETNLNAWPLWIAVPGFAPGAAVSGMGPWTKWTFQQYSWTGRVPGIGNASVDVDLDAFEGDLADLAAYQIPVITHTITASSLPVAEAVPGTVLTVNATIESTVPRKLLLGAAFYPAGSGSGAVSDNAGANNLVTLTTGPSEVSRDFTLPAAMAPGKYDLQLFLINDMNGDGLIAPGDTTIGLVHRHANALTVTVTPSFAVWASDQGLTGAQAAADFDADGDGAENLAEYAFGTLPRSAGSAPREPRLVWSAPGELTFTFPRASNRPDLTWTVESSADLSAWSAFATVSGDAPFTGPAWSVAESEPALVSLRFAPLTATQPLLFLRVRAEQR